MDLRLPDRVPRPAEFNAITEEAEKIPDFKDRMDFYKKCYPTFIGTYVFSYISRLADHGYMNEIEDVSWTSAIRRIPMITMVEIGVDIPKDLSREEKELYQKIAELRHDKETAQEESFLEKMKNLFK